MVTSDVCSAHHGTHGLAGRPPTRAPGITVKPQPASRQVAARRAATPSVRIDQHASFLADGIAFVRGVLLAAVSDGEEM
jgi:hypothetical protein